MEPNIWLNIWTAAKKFGLDYDDFPTMMDNVAFLLKVLTINIYKKAKNPNIVFYLLTLVAGSIYLHVHITSLVWMLFFRYGFAEIESAIIVFAISSCNVTCLVKFLFMKIYAKEIKNTVHQFLQCDTLVIPKTRFAKNLRKNLRVVKKRASIIWIFFITIGVVYVSIPFFVPGRQFTNDVFLVYGLEPMLESPNYELSMFTLTVGIEFGVYTMVAVAVYVLVVVGYSESQIRALSFELRNVWEDSENFYNHIKHRIIDKVHAVTIKEQIMNEFIRVRLKDVIQFHVANINLLHQLDNEFSPTLAIEYVIMWLAVIAGLLGGLEHSFLQLPYTFVQIFMDCLAGQRLIDACEDFRNSVYSCQWENFNRNNQKSVLLMLIMSQKTLMLSAGGMASLNFNLLMVIFRSTYSSYTTLESVVKK